MGAHGFLEPLTVRDEQLLELVTRLTKTFGYLALHSEGQFLPTPVTALPQGYETGQYLAIDVGGSNLRIGFLELLGGAQHCRGKIGRSYEKAWPIEEHFKMDNAHDLFSWIGDCIALVVTNKMKEDYEGGTGPVNTIPLGVTFSFPMVQHTISEATLMTMGKGFAIGSTSNLGHLLLAGYERHIHKQTLVDAGDNGATPDRALPRLTIASISNDTVATLAASSYAAASTSNCKAAVGLIVGTGTNATVPMRLSSLHHSKRERMRLPSVKDGRDAMTIVNTEWGINGSIGPLREMDLVTSWDSDLNQGCEAPDFQPFEYMTSGRYMGELVRLVLLDYLTNHERISHATLPQALQTRNAITTTFLSTTLATSESMDALVIQLQSKVPPPFGSKWKWSRTSAEMFRMAADRVSTRSARLNAAAVAALLFASDHLQAEAPTGESNEASAETKTLLIAYAGGVIEQYPGYLEMCESTTQHIVAQLAADQARVKFCETKDGGIVGAGVLAGMVWNQKR
ncbi:MAG: hypothetical protein M1828_004682 [Chrysothrix sp. TS-e1954]|nr:MAG: hypothetical protein M1828_004682 [Chrysothrix sp. TS-e1954]